MSPLRGSRLCGGSEAKAHDLATEAPSNVSESYDRVPVERLQSSLEVYHSGAYRLLTDGAGVVLEDTTESGDGKQRVGWRGWQG